jgi:predicted flap endonuclease-1-like 5' DNA nuclease
MTDTTRLHFDREVHGEPFNAPFAAGHSAYHGSGTPIFVASGEYDVASSHTGQFLISDAWTDPNADVPVDEPSDDTPDDTHGDGDIDTDDLETLDGIGSVYAERLYAAGFPTATHVREADPATLEAIDGISVELSRELTSSQADSGAGDVENE